MRTALTITGDKQLLKMLRELPKAVERKVNRRAVNLATTPILNAVKSETPVYGESTDSKPQKRDAHGRFLTVKPGSERHGGDLKAAQAKKVYSRGARANGIVGADADYTGEEIGRAHV